MVLGFDLAFWNFLMWPALTILAFTVLLTLHLYWRRRLARREREFRASLDQLQTREQRQMLQIQSQQETLLNSMVEGLLVLDDQGRIQLANRAFAALFGVNGDIRGRTILEALRLHELSELVQQLQVEHQ